MKPLCLVFVGALLVTPAPGTAEPDCKAVQTPDQRRDADTIKRLEQGWLAAEFHGDVDFLDCLLAPGYGVISAKDAVVRTKADLLQRVAGNRGKTTAVPPLETAVVVNGDSALAYSVMKGTKKTGEPYEARYVDAYVFQEGVWHPVAGTDL